MPESLTRKAFKRLHYPVDIIAQCVCWYLAYVLSLRNLEKMMVERGVVVDHSTLLRWIIRLVPLLDKAFRRHKHPVGRRWRMDETCIKIKGKWRYLYRSANTAGQTIDKNGANTTALATLNANKSEEERMTIRQSKYLNNLIEQDHRNIKRRIRSMLGFKLFRRSQTILAGIELIHMLRKGQYHHQKSDGLSPAEQFYLLAA